MNVISAYNSTQVYQTNQTTATKAISEYETTTSSEAIDKMDMMKEKYKDVYTPIPETYTKESEELQTAKILEAYPNYITGTEFLEQVDAALEGEPITLGQKLTQEELDKQKLDYEQAYEKVYSSFGGKEAYVEMARGVKEIENKYPVNSWGKDENIHNSKELSRFSNAAVYEGLENGKTVDEAKREALSLMNSYMDVSFMIDDFTDTLVKAGITGTDTEVMDYDYGVDYSNPNNSTWDLRKYGIDGQWQEYSIYENDAAMISELEKELEQYSFLLNNKNLVEKENNKLTESNRGYFNVYEKDIENNYLPNTQSALDIFKNYQIYDSINVKV